MEEELQRLREEFEDLRNDFNQHQHSGNITNRVSALDLEPDDEKYLLGVEVKTRKTWTDSRPIYRQVVDFGALPNNTSKVVAFAETLPIAEFGSLVSLQPVFYNNTSTPPVLWGQNNSTDLTNYIQWRTYTNATNTEVWCDTNYNATGLDAHVIVEYTRTNV